MHYIVLSASIKTPYAHVLTLKAREIVSCMDHMVRTPEIHWQQLSTSSLQQSVLIS